MANNISVIIHTKNSAQTLERALRSLSFATEILVVDMHSTDNTVSIAQKYQAKVKYVKDTDFVEPARNYALKQVSTEWTFILDADEEVPATLASALPNLINTEDQTIGYYFPRKNLIFSKWIEHTGWWPDYQLRLFKTGCVKWPSTIHAQPIVNGTTKTLPAEVDLAIIHHNYQSVEQFVDRLNRYTTHTVTDSQSTEFNDNFTTAQLFSTFSKELLSRYFSQAGWQDGRHGLSLSLLQAMYEVIIKLKVWQKKSFEVKTESMSQVLSEMRTFQKDLNYWIADWQVEQSQGLTKVWWQFRRKLKI